MKWKLLILIVLVLAISLLLFLFLTKGTDELDFQSGTYYYKVWNDPAGTYKGPAVPDKETALAIAKAVFNGMEKSNEAKKYVPSSIFYDEEDEIWIVSFGPVSSQLPNGAYMVGGGLSIAVQKSDGKILKIWFGE